MRSAGCNFQSSSKTDMFFLPLDSLSALVWTWSSRWTNSARFRTWFDEAKSEGASPSTSIQNFMVAQTSLGKPL